MRWSPGKYVTWRSADAAQQVKNLITESVNRVDEGSSMVNRAGETTDEVVIFMRKVTDIVSEISSASCEQSAGVNQVGDTVTLMDQNTQQNAALVEQTAAATVKSTGACYAAAGVCIAV